MYAKLGNCVTQDCSKLPYLQSVQPGTNISINNTDKRNPIINATCSGGGFNYIDISTTYSASPNDYIFTDTSGGTFTITLPTTPANGATIVIADATKSWGNTGPSTPIVVTAGGSDLILSGGTTSSSIGNSTYGATLKLTYYIADSWWILEILIGTSSSGSSFTLCIPPVGLYTTPFVSGVTIPVDIVSDLGLPSVPTAMIIGLSINLTYPLSWSPVFLEYYQISTIQVGTGPSYDPTFWFTQQNAGVAGPTSLMVVSGSGGENGGLNAVYNYTGDFSTDYVSIAVANPLGKAVVPQGFYYDLYMTTGSTIDVTLTLGEVDPSMTPTTQSVSVFCIGYY